MKGRVFLYCFLSFYLSSCFSSFFFFFWSPFLTNRSWFKFPEAKACDLEEGLCGSLYCLTYSVYLDQRIRIFNKETIWIEQKEVYDVFASFSEEERRNFLFGTYFVLAKIHEEGIGQTIDLEKALFFYQKIQSIKPLRIFFESIERVWF